MQSTKPENTLPHRWSRFRIFVFELKWNLCYVLNAFIFFYSVGIGMETRKVYVVPAPQIPDKALLAALIDLIEKKIDLLKIGDDEKKYI